jgi:molecular chaperone GrpE
MAEHKKREKKEAEPVKNHEAEQGGDAQPAQSEGEVFPAEDVEALNAELEKQRAKCSEYFDGWQRERADFANFRRRIERDQAATHQNLQGSIIKKYLPVLDDMGRALKARPDCGDAAAPGKDTGASWANGIELIYRKLQSILESEGVQRMPAETELFDPSRHEAISMEPSPNHQSGEIIEVIQDGYLIGDRVLRPALVRVAA